jgi:hypothetical protein
MNKVLIKDYMIDNGLLTCGEDAEIGEISVAGEWVMFVETDTSGYYKEHRRIELLDLIAWVYAQQSGE